jgi:hypothetical protein
VAVISNAFNTALHIEDCNFRLCSAYFGGGVYLKRIVRSRLRAFVLLCIFVSSDCLFLHSNAETQKSVEVFQTTFENCSASKRSPLLSPPPGLQEIFIFCNLKVFQAHYSIPNTLLPSVSLDALIVDPLETGRGAALYVFDYISVVVRYSDFKGSVGDPDSSTV